MFGSKNKESIYSKIRAFMDNPEATEAEMDAFLDEFTPGNTPDPEALQALTVERDALAAQVQELQGQVAAATAAGDTLAQEIETLTSQLADAQGNLRSMQIENGQAQDAIAALEEEKKTLGIQLATIKVKAGGLKTEGDGITTPNGGDGLDGEIVKTEHLDSFLNGAKAQAQAS
ncbi:MAG: hypothetical protein KDC70_01190 [Saprospiraceae bacterium]|nr:hypothetical protein [Saprospiraceae bacterium]